MKLDVIAGEILLKGGMQTDWPVSWQGPVDLMMDAIKTRKGIQDISEKWKAVAERLEIAMAMLESCVNERCAWIPETSFIEWLDRTLLEWAEQMSCSDPPKVALIVAEALLQVQNGLVVGVQGAAVVSGGWTHSYGLGRSRSGRLLAF
jgi:hypothetical protein